MSTVSQLESQGEVLSKRAVLPIMFERFRTCHAHCSSRG